MILPVCHLCATAVPILLCLFCVAHLLCPHSLCPSAPFCNTCAYLCHLCQSVLSVLPMPFCLVGLKGPTMASWWSWVCPLHSELSVPPLPIRVIQYVVGTICICTVCTCLLSIPSGDTACACLSLSASYCPQLSVLSVLSTPVNTICTSIPLCLCQCVLYVLSILSVSICVYSIFTVCTACATIVSL